MLFFLILFIYLLIPLLSLSVRRLHDTGRSGLYLFLNLIPFVNYILLIFYCEDSTPYSNIYGPSTKYMITNLIPLEDQINIITQGNVAYNQRNVVSNQGNVVSTQGNVVSIIQPTNNFIQNPQNNIVYYNQNNNPYPNQKNNISPGNVDYTPQVYEPYPQNNNV